MSREIQSLVALWPPFTNGITLGRFCNPVQLALAMLTSGAQDILVPELSGGCKRLLSAKHVTGMPWGTGRWASSQWHMLAHIPR